MAQIYMTKEELKAEIIHCRYLNENVRLKNKEYVVGFSWALFLCICLLAVLPLCIYKMQEFPIVVGVLIGLSVFGLILAGICIFFLVCSIKELKKCNEMDIELDHQEEKLYNLDLEESNVNIMA